MNLALEPEKKKVCSIPHVAVFQACWHVHPQTVNTVEALLSLGYAVDVYLYRARENLLSLAYGNHDGRLRVIRFAGRRNETALAETSPPAGRTRAPGIVSSMRGLLVKLVDRLPLMDRVFYRLHTIDRQLVLPKNVLNASLTQAKRAGYECLIGIERGGLMWAGTVAAHLDCPYVYFSLELYTRDYPGKSDNTFFRRLKRLERRYHAKAAATIVQDVDRARVLLADNGVKSADLLFVPVSLIGDPIRERSEYLRHRLKLGPKERIILSFGKIGSRRFTDELVTVAQGFPDDWKLVIHDGSCTNEKYKAELAQRNTHGKVVFSWDCIPIQDIEPLVASADIGLAFYRDDTWNEYLTGRSSEKVARYAQAGIPMVAFGYPSFQKVFSEYRCGVCIDHIERLAEACAQIFADYLGYRQEAWRAYEEVYDFVKQFQTVGDWLSRQTRSNAGKSSDGRLTANGPVTAKDDIA